MSESSLCITRELRTEKSSFEITRRRKAESHILHIDRGSIDISSSIIDDTCGTKVRLYDIDGSSE